MSLLDNFIAPSGGDPGNPHTHGGSVRCLWCGERRMEATHFSCAHARRDQTGGQNSTTAAVASSWILLRGQRIASGSLLSAARTWRMSSSGPPDASNSY